MIELDDQKAEQKLVKKLRRLKIERRIEEELSKFYKDTSHDTKHDQAGSSPLHRSIECAVSSRWITTNRSRLGLQIWVQSPQNRIQKENPKTKERQLFLVLKRGQLKTPAGQQQTWPTNEFSVFACKKFDG